MAEATRYADEIIDDGFPWYAIRLFTTRQGEVKSYFEEQGFECLTNIRLLTTGRKVR